MIKLPMPPTTNAGFKVGNGRFYQSQAYKDYKVEAGFIVKSKVRKPTTHPVKMILHFWFQRDRDIDSGVKCLLDALNGVLYEDDKQIIELRLIKSLLCDSITLDEPVVFLLYEYIIEHEHVNGSTGEVSEVSTLEGYNLDDIPY